MRQWWQNAHLSTNWQCSFPDENSSCIPAANSLPFTPLPSSSWGFIVNLTWRASPGIIFKSTYEGRCSSEPGPQLQNTSLLLSPSRTVRSEQQLKERFVQLSETANCTAWIRGRNSMKSAVALFSMFTTWSARLPEAVWSDKILIFAKLVWRHTLHSLPTNQISCFASRDSTSDNGTERTTCTAALELSQRKRQLVPFLVYVWSI